MNIQIDSGDKMGLGSFIEGPLLKIVFLVFSIVILFRIIFFVSAIIRNRRDIKDKGGNLYVIFARFFIPFHRAVLKRPFYSSLRYVFHFCLFVVPIWLTGHIALWEESRLEWSWTSLPDRWSDWMTIIVLALAVFFIIRHFAIKEVSANTSFSDYLIIVIAALPFASGFLLVHGTLDSIPFFSENLWTMHILTGEIMIVAVAFLFCRTRMNVLKCTGCGSCVLSCPTGTLESEDSGNLRVFHYSHYQCICCGSCVDTCPENAADLRHEIGLAKFVQIFAKHEIRSVKLESCTRCGALFVPEPLLGKIQKNFAYEYLKLCPNCRKLSMGDYLKQHSPWHRTQRQSAP
jgi:ferredoxin